MQSDIRTQGLKNNFRQKTVITTVSTCINLNMFFFCEKIKLFDYLLSYVTTCIYSSIINFKQQLTFDFTVNDV